MVKPEFVVVTGAPGTSKTVLAGKLATSLHLPLIAKDMIKEPLMNALPVVDRETSMRVGNATFRLLFALSASFLHAGVGLILEAPVTRQHSAADLRNLARRSSMMIVHCTPHPAITVDRYRARFRSGQRHPGHFDGAVLETLAGRIAAGEYDPPAIDVPIIRVDTTDGYIPGLGEVVAWLRPSG